MSDQELPGRESTSLRIWQLAWPTIASYLLFTLVGFMHIKIASGLGTQAVAAVTTGHRIFFLIQAVLMGISVAATAIISRAWGANDIRGAEMASWTSLGVSMILAAILAIPVLLIPETLAGLFGLDDATTKEAARFIFWFGIFNIATAVNMMLQTALRATGDVITPLYFLCVSSMLNLLFGYSLAYGWGPLPALGVSGVALGGGSAALIVTLTFATVWWKGHFGLKPIKKLAFDRAAVRQLAVIGAPSMLEQGIIQVAFLLFFSIVAQYGNMPYAAYGIGISIVSFSIVVGFGFGIAAATLVGQQLGAGRPDQAIAAGWRALRMGVGAMSLFSLILAWFARDLAQFMIDDPDVIDYTAAFIYIIALAQPFMAVEMALAGALRGAGDTRFPLLTTFCGLFLGRLLPAWLFYKLGLSVYWIFVVMLFDYILKATMMILYYKSHKWVNVNVAAPQVNSTIT